MSPWKPKRACPDCRKLRCMDPRHGLEKDREADARRAWVGTNGWLCPGIGRPQHEVARGQLTAYRVSDEPRYEVCCKNCRKRLL